MIRLYLAGPEVFHRDALRLGAAKQSACARCGFKGLYPLDGNPDESLGAQLIYDRCVQMMQAADGGIFNLTPFRGASADVGTVLEFATMAALGKPIFAYSNVAENLIDRVRASPGLRLDADGRTWWDADDMSVEDFGLADNLMLEHTLARQGRRLHRVSGAHAERFIRLDGFLACLQEARHALLPPASPATVELP